MSQTPMVLALAGIKIGIAFLIISNAFSLFKYELNSSFEFILLSGIAFILFLVILSSLITVLNNLMPPLTVIMTLPHRALIS